MSQREQKSTDCKISNSDYRLILTFVNFIEKYFYLDRSTMVFELYVHKTRKNDLNRIVNFWSKKIQIPTELIKIYWKRNKVVGRRANQDYVGQILVRVRGEKILGSKLLALSAIILSKYQRGYIAGSANGRPADFGSVYRGSNPCPAADREHNIHI